MIPETDYLEIQIAENAITFGTDHIATEIRSNTISRKLKMLLKGILVPLLLYAYSSGIVSLLLTAVALDEAIQGKTDKLRRYANLVLSLGIIVLASTYISVATLRSMYRTRYRYNSDIKTNYLNGTEKQCVIRNGTDKYEVVFGTNREFEIDGADNEITVSNESFNFFKTLKTATLRVKPLVGIPDEVLALAAVVNYLRGKTRFVHHRARLLFIFGKMLTFAQYVSMIPVLVSGGGLLIARIKTQYESQR
jgi:hypothetical protein